MSLKKYESQNSLETGMLNTSQANREIARLYRDTADRERHDSRAQFTVGPKT